MTEHAVVIAGSGPTGMMLAAELARPVTAPTAVLIRPDGYVAWVGAPAEPGLPDALTGWFGPPARRSTRPRTNAAMAGRCMER